MAKSVRAGNFYRVTGRGLFDIICGVLKPGDVVMVVNPPGGRKSGILRHVVTERGEMTLANITFLEPHPHYARTW